MLPLAGMAYCVVPLPYSVVPLAYSVVPLPYSGWYASLFNIYASL